MIKLFITIYAIYLHYNLYPKKMDLISIILLILFPGFFIAATATINLNYLNPFYKQDISEYHYGNFLDDLKDLKNINVRFFTIFLPIYLFIIYTLYYDFFKNYLNDKTPILKKIKNFFIEKKNHITENKIYYLVIYFIVNLKYFMTRRLFQRVAFR